MIVQIAAAIFAGSNRRDEAPSIALDARDKNVQIIDSFV